MWLQPLYRQTKEQLTDKIIKDCLKGSARAQRHLFDMYYSDGMNTALRYSNNPEDAREILSNAFIRVFDKLDQFDPGRGFIPWFKKIIVHASSDFYRYRKNNVISLESLPEVTFDNQIIDDLAYQELLEMIQQLSPVLRSVFNLYTIEGYKHQEIAEILNISEGTSKSHLHRARAKLQIMITEHAKKKGIGSIRREDKTKVNKGT